MNNTAQTIAIIASLVVVFGAQTAWILRAFVQVDKRLDRIDARSEARSVALREDLRDSLGRIDDRLTHLEREHDAR